MGHMDTGLFGLAVLVAVLVAPAFLHLYLSHLPVAPACPSCHATTRVTAELPLARWLPAALVTARGECAECGWRGRMRWQWAARTAVRRRG